MANTIYELYGEYWAKPDPGFVERVNQSLDPRRPGVLYDLFGRLGVGHDHLVLDIGCRDADHTEQIVRRFGCRAIAIDPVPFHMEKARERIAAAGLEGRIQPVRAAIESLPLRASCIDYIWCRDMLNHVDLPQGFVECARVLRPGGSMFIYVTLATELLEPREAKRLYKALAIVPENMVRDYFERTAREAGFEITDRDPIDSEWREASLERGDQEIVEDLLRASRMRRQEEELVQQYGRKRFEACYAGDLWGVYQLLGKLCPTVYVLEKP